MGHLQIAHWPEYQGCAQVDYELIEFHPEKRKFFRSRDAKWWENILKHNRGVGDFLALAPIVTVSQSALDDARRRSRCVSNDQSPPVLSFRRGEMLCLDGQSRVRAILNSRAGSATNRFELVHLILDEIDDRKQNEILHGSCHQITPNCSKLYAEIKESENFDGRQRNRQLRSTLKESELQGLTALENCERLFDAFNKVREALPTMTHGFLFSQFKAYHATFCEISMERYLVGYVYKFWEKMGEEARSKMQDREKFPLHQIPSEAFDQLQGLMPGVSDDDEAKVHKAFSRPGMFGALGSRHQEALKTSILSSHCMIPSLRLFTVHVRVLERVSSCLKDMLGLSGQRGGRRQGCFRPLESVLGDFYSLDRNRNDEYQIQTINGWRTIHAPFEDRRELSCRQLWLFAMRHAGRADQTDPGLLARVATRLGFHSESITAHAAASAISADDNALDPSTSWWTELATVSVKERLGQKGSRWLKKIANAQKYLFFDIAETIGTESDQSSLESKRCTTLVELACIYRALFGKPLSPSPYAVASHAGNTSLGTQLAVNIAESEPALPLHPSPDQSDDLPDASSEQIEASTEEIETSTEPIEASSEPIDQPAHVGMDTGPLLRVVAEEEYRSTETATRDLDFSRCQKIDPRPIASLIGSRSSPNLLSPITIFIPQQSPNGQTSILDMMGGDDTRNTELIQNEDDVQPEQTNAASPPYLGNRIEETQEDPLRLGAEAGKPCENALNNCGPGLSTCFPSPAARTSRGDAPCELHSTKLHHDRGQVTQTEAGFSQTIVSNDSAGMNSYDDIPGGVHGRWSGDNINDPSQPNTQFDSTRQYRSSMELFITEDMSEQGEACGDDAEQAIGSPAVNQDRQKLEPQSAPQLTLESDGHVLSEIDNMDLETALPSDSDVFGGEQDQGIESSILASLQEPGLRSRSPPPSSAQSSRLPTTASTSNWQAPFVNEVYDISEDDVSMRDRSASPSTGQSLDNAMDTMASEFSSSTSHGRHPLDSANPTNTKTVDSAAENPALVGRIVGAKRTRVRKPHQKESSYTMKRSVLRKRLNSDGSVFMAKRRCIEFAVRQRRLDKALLERARARLRERTGARLGKVVHGPRSRAAMEELQELLASVRESRGSEPDRSASGTLPLYSSRQAMADGNNSLNGRQTDPDAMDMASDEMPGATMDMNLTMDPSTPEFASSDRLAPGEGFMVIPKPPSGQPSQSLASNIGACQIVRGNDTDPRSSTLLVDDASTIHLSSSAIASKQGGKQPRSSCSGGHLSATDGSSVLAEDPAWVEIPNTRACLGLSDLQGVESVHFVVPNDTAIPPPPNHSQSWNLQTESAAGIQSPGLPLQADQEADCKAAALGQALLAHITSQNNNSISTVQKLRRKRAKSGKNGDCIPLASSFAFFVELDGPNIQSVHCRAKATIKPFLERHIRNSRDSGGFFDRNLRIVELDPSKHGATSMDRFFQAEDVLVYQQADDNGSDERTLMEEITRAVQLKKREVIAACTSHNHTYRLRARRRKKH